MGTLRIALVHDFLFTYAGGERVLKSLHEIYPDAPIFTLTADPLVVEKHFPKADIRTSYLQKSWRRRFPRLLLAAYPQAIESFDFNEFDLVISSSGAFSHGIVTGPDTIHVCYCHTPMRYVWDWHAEHVEERGLNSALIRFGWESLMHQLRLWDAIAAKRVDYWLANSQTVAERIASYYRQKAEVIYPAIDTTSFDLKSAPQKSSQPTAITVSRLSANKRIDLIIEACAKVGLPLIVVGEGKELTTLKNLAEKLKADVTFTGSLSEVKKREELAKAHCFIFAAEDDFGIAPVEALASGTPVIALNKGGVRETVESSKSGLFFAEPTVPELGRALRHFLENGVSFDSDQIRQSAQRFDTKTFEKHIQQYITHVTS